MTRFCVWEQLYKSDLNRASNNTTKPVLACNETLSRLTMVHPAGISCDLIAVIMQPGGH